MFFKVSKFAWLFLKPSHFLVLLALFGVLLAFTRFQKTGKSIALLSLVTLIVLANIETLGPNGIRSQENRIERTYNQQIEPDGILVLGGFVNRKVTESRGGLQVYGNADRLLEMIRLMSLYPKAKVVFSGGWGDGTGFSKGEADYVAAYLNDLPFDLSRLTVESKSRNTRENIRFSRQLVQPKPSEKWLLVTSAQHIPRAVSEAKAQGWTLIGHPVDYLTTREEPEQGKKKSSAFTNLHLINHAAYELLGRLAYWLTAES